jgi:hypothetical protein
MKRIGSLVVLAPVLCTLVLAAGCGKHKTATPALVQPSPTAAGSGPPAGSPSASVSASPALAVEFTVDGAGPYQLGTTLSALQATASVSGVTAGGQPCPDDTVAQATAPFEGIQLRFHKDGNLYLEVNKSPAVPTPSGAWLGTTHDQLKTIYAAVPGEDLAHGTATAFLVTTLTGRAILFQLDAGQKVTAMVAGDGDYLKATYQAGAEFC